MGLGQVGSRVARLARAFGIVASIVGLFFSKIREEQDPMTGLNRGYYLTSVLAAAGFFVARLRA